MSKEDYYKFIVGDTQSALKERIGKAIEKGIINAKKRTERPGYRFSARQRMIQAMKSKI